MAKKNTSMEIYDVPATLQEHPFYGLRLDEYQKVFRDAIWDTEKLIVFCNAKAGTGKTLIATATANLLINTDGVMVSSILPLLLRSRSRDI